MVKKKEFDKDEHLLSDEEFEKRFTEGAYDEIVNMKFNQEFLEFLSNTIKKSVKEELKKTIEHKNNEDDVLIVREQDNSYQVKSKDNEYDFSDWVIVSNVKQILDEKGLKQSWLQQKTQIPISTLRSILTNEKGVSLENAMRISIVMEMPITKLFAYISLGDITTEE